MLEGGEASFEYVVRDLIWSRGLVWCQFVKGPFYLCYCDVEICFHRFRVVCIWDVTKVCWWWRWEEGSTQCGRFLFIGCCFTFQCRDVGVGGVELRYLLTFQMLWSSASLTNFCHVSRLLSSILRL